jgi:hypothetical protein
VFRLFRAVVSQPCASGETDIRVAQKRVARLSFAFSYPRLGHQFTIMAAQYHSSYVIKMMTGSKGATCCLILLRGFLDAKFVAMI